MPIINIKFIEGVVATPEQKLELIQKMTDTFVGVLGDVVRPFTYCIIDETPVNQWGIAGVPMPDLAQHHRKRATIHHPVAGTLLR
jgi:4-oxalocrotonate tautomerase